MRITRRSSWSGITRTRDLPITSEQYGAWQNGMLIQRAMPQLSAEDREWVITGVTEAEWQEMFLQAEDDV